MDLLSSLQTEYIGSKYSLQEFYLYKDESGADFFVDAIHIGKRATTMVENGKQLDSSFYFEVFFRQHIVCFCNNSTLWSM